MRRAAIVLVITIVVIVIITSVYASEAGRRNTRNALAVGSVVLLANHKTGAGLAMLGGTAIAQHRYQQAVNERHERQGYWRGWRDEARVRDSYHPRQHYTHSYRSDRSYSRYNADGGIYSYRYPGEYNYYSSDSGGYLEEYPTAVSTTYVESPRRYYHPEPKYYRQRDDDIVCVAPGRYRCSDSSGYRKSQYRADYDTEYNRSDRYHDESCEYSRPKRVTCDNDATTTRVIVRVRTYSDDD